MNKFSDLEIGILIFVVKLRIKNESDRERRMIIGEGSEKYTPSQRQLQSDRVVNLEIILEKLEALRLER